MIPVIQIPDVCERDIDLLLLEEFTASPEFCSWFLKRIGFDEHSSLGKACRSVKTGNGESDLELTFAGAGGSLMVLVENKVDAMLQPRQAERYTERASAYARKAGDIVVTALLAPQVYFAEEDNDLGFNATVAYEELLDWFAAAGHLGRRREYKLTLLRNAIDRGRAGWTLVPHPQVGEFWLAYWRVAERIAPQLAMPLPKAEIPASSNFILFRPADLPRSVSLMHKVTYGNVDLQFAGMGERLAEMEEQYRQFLLPSMRIERANKSAVIRIRVEPADMTTTAFCDCEGTMRKGIEAAVILMEWYRKVLRK